MRISRDKAIEILDALAAPLGPLTSHAERLARQDRWVAEGGAELLTVLLELVVSPPAEDDLPHASIDDWNTLLVEMTGALGKLHPEVALQRLLPLLDDDQTRGAAIDILGSVGDVRVVPELEKLMRDRRLGEEDLVHLAGALGEIGGDEACRLLRQLRQTIMPGQRALQREIDIAAQVARCDQATS